MTIPSIIKQQLIQTSIIKLGSWGAHDWIAISPICLGFKINARYLTGIICIELDEKQDLYNICFFENTIYKSLNNCPAEAFSPTNGVYCDQLVDLIDERVEQLKP